MLRNFSVAIALLFGLAISANAGSLVGADPNALADGSVDGWSGISVLDGPGNGTIDAGESVDTFSFYAQQERVDAGNTVTPLIVQNAGGTFSIWEVGPEQTSPAGGVNSAAWGSNAVPADGNSYHLGLFMRSPDLGNGGIVPFSDAGGQGMFQMQVSDDAYVPAAGDEVTNGHASDPGGRGYQATFHVVPEPGTFALAAVAILGFGAMSLRRRRRVS